MKIKRIGSTEAQNNFGRVLDSVARSETAYVIDRRNVAEAWVISNSELIEVLNSQVERKRVLGIARELSSREGLGRELDDAKTLTDASKSKGE